MITGPEFEAGGRRWRIFLCPLGFNVQDHISIYLEADPNGVHSCVQFAFVLWNPKDPTQYVFINEFNRFTVNKSCWGFSGFSI